MVASTAERPNVEPHAGDANAAAAWLREHLHGHLVAELGSWDGTGHRSSDEIAGAVTASVLRHLDADNAGR